jgi:uncharacterized protein YukE
MKAAQLGMTGPEWLMWKRQEQTQAFLSLLRQSVSEIQEGWSNKAYLSDDLYKSATLNAGALGMADALQGIIEAIEDIAASNDPEEQEQKT